MIYAIEPTQKTWEAMPEQVLTRLAEREHAAAMRGETKKEGVVEILAEAAEDMGIMSREEFVRRIKTMSGTGRGA